MRHTNLTIRAIALMGAGSAAVHQLRYAIGYGGGAGHALAAHPHGYMGIALPGVLTAALIVLASVALRMARGSAPACRSAPARRSLVVLWIACAVALAAIFSSQETLEGAGALAHGGWIGLALSVPVGLAVALALRGARAAEALTGERSPLVGFSIFEVAVLTAARTLHGRPGRGLRLARGPPPSFVV